MPDLSLTPGAEDFLLFSSKCVMVLHFTCKSTIHYIGLYSECDIQPERVLSLETIGSQCRLLSERCCRREEDQGKQSQVAHDSPILGLFPPSVNKQSRPEDR